MRKLCLLPLAFSLLFCANSPKDLQNPSSKSQKKSQQVKQKDTNSKNKEIKNQNSKPFPLSSQDLSHQLMRWFVGAGAGANYSFVDEKPFAMLDLKAGITYDNQWGRSYIYTNISYAYLEGWNKLAQKSKGYLIDTLINTDLSVKLFESPSFSFLLMFGVGIGGRWIERSYTQIHPYAQKDSFFITNLNIALRSEIAKEHIISLTLKPQLTKGWYQNRELTFEYLKEMSLLLSYTFWKF